MQSFHFTDWKGVLQFGAQYDTRTSISQMLLL